MIHRITFADGSYCQWYDPRYGTAPESFLLGDEQHPLHAAKKATALAISGRNSTVYAESFSGYTHPFNVAVERMSRPPRGRYALREWLASHVGPTKPTTHA